LLNESEYIPHLIDSLHTQVIGDFTITACVNQPDEWWDDRVKKHVCANNTRTIEILQKADGLNLKVIDRSSRGKGWDKKNFGVGWARKIAMDEIAGRADDNDIILCMDGDTVFNRFYLSAVIETFEKNQEIVALAIPYYHKLTGINDKDRSILRYEIYMRYYLLNLFRIKNPYSFTAIGSAMAVPVWAYRKVGGMTPFKSGEDFYFMQKMAKNGPVGIWCDEQVFPAARFSDRVFFGTGPAMIRGNAGDWSGYPVYAMEGFDKVAETYGGFGQLFAENISTPMDSFLLTKFKEKNIWQPLRDNFKNKDQFVKACMKKIDALRILQFLKAINKDGNDEDNLREFLENNYLEVIEEQDIDLENFNFSGSSTDELDEIRNLLYSIEIEQRKKISTVGIY
jgi:hypothetical protein